MNIVLSIVSHGQGKLIKNLLEDIKNIKVPSNFNIRVILTLNIQENEYFLANKNCTIIRNKNPKGFGSNHNYAFKKFDSDYFIVVNPDIRIKHLDLLNLLDLSIHCQMKIYHSNYLFHKMHI